VLEHRRGGGGDGAGRDDSCGFRTAARDETAQRRDRAEDVRHAAKPAGVEDPRERASCAKHERFRGSIRDVENAADLLMRETSPLTEEESGPLARFEKLEAAMQLLGSILARRHRRTCVVEIIRWQQQLPLCPSARASLTFAADVACDLDEPRSLRSRAHASIDRAQSIEERLLQRVLGVVVGAED
jgi:hypothetical protein